MFLINFTFIYMEVHKVDRKIERAPGSQKFGNIWFRQLGANIEKKTSFLYSLNDTVCTRFLCNTVCTRFLCNTVCTRFLSDTVCTRFLSDTVCTRFLSDTICTRFLSDTVCTRLISF